MKLPLLKRLAEKTTRAEPSTSSVTSPPSDKKTLPSPPGIKPWQKGSYMPSDYEKGEYEATQKDFETVVKYYRKALEQRGIKISRLRRLGGGALGIAYDVGGNKVLKVTLDAQEAAAAHHVKNKKLNNVYEVYDVVEFDHLNLYGIYQKKYAKKLEDNRPLYIFYDKIYWGPINSALEKKMSIEGARARVEQFISKNPKYDTDEIRHFVEGIFNGIQELHANGISHTDSHNDNIMLDLDGKSPFFIDLGKAKTPPAPIEDI